MTERVGDALTATLTLTDENGTAHPSRTMMSASCDELVESAAIVISLVLREQAPAAAQPIEQVTEQPSEVPVEQPPHDALYSPSPAPGTTRALELGVATSSARHSALVLGGRLERRRAALGVDVELAMPEQVDVSHGSVHVIAVRAGGAGCLRARSFTGCALAAAGFVRAQGEDLMDARTSILPVASLGMRAEWRQRLTRHVGLRVFATVDQVLVRPSFVVGDTSAWTSPLVQAWLGGGVFWQLP